MQSTGHALYREAIVSLVAASIRNALANESVLRIKTNSLGEANIENVKAGRYFLVGASTLGQVGVVWSKPIDLSNGVNDVSLSLRDTAGRIKLLVLKLFKNSKIPYGI